MIFLPRFFFCIEKKQKFEAQFIRIKQIDI
jgi:hypothetical protein